MQPDFAACLEGELAHFLGRPAASGLIRATAEDFQVDELLGFAPDGAGEHALLRIRKRGANTEWVARQLARLAGLPAREIGYAGMKDRQALTTQWFSVPLAGRPEPDWTALDGEQLQLLEAHRHRRKLRRGSHRGNAFVLTVRELRGERAEIEARLAHLAAEGAPNYFGEQRFGRDQHNLAQAAALFAGQRVRDRHQRGLYLSAARSLLFNRVLSRRIDDGSWNQALPGEALLLAGTQSFFVCDEPDAAINARLAAKDVHPSGPLWGRGEPPSRDRARALELEALADCQAWCAGLEMAGMTQERRALRLMAEGLGWEWPADDCLRLSFRLPRGAYATALLRELVAVVGADVPGD